jgi:hypothetical protein
MAFEMTDIILTPLRRRVIKETASSAPRDWIDPKKWGDRLPQEIRIHQLLEERRAADRTMCRHLVHMRGHRLFMLSRRYRLYMDMYSCGDLWDAMASHDRYWLRREDDQGASDSSLPEAYIWYVIRALAGACTVLQTGTIDGEPVEGWKPITHLDLELSNVLLSMADRDVDPESGATERGKAAGTSNEEVEVKSKLFGHGEI